MMMEDAEGDADDREWKTYQKSVIIGDVVGV